MVQQGAQTIEGRGMIRNKSVNGSLVAMKQLQNNGIVPPESAALASAVSAVSVDVHRGAVRLAACHRCRGALCGHSLHDPMQALNGPAAPSNSKARTTAAPALAAAVAARRALPQCLSEPPHLQHLQASVPRHMPLSPAAHALLQDAVRLMAHGVALWLRGQLADAPSTEPFSVFVGLAGVTVDVFLDNLAQLAHELTGDHTVFVLMTLYLRRLLRRRSRFPVTWRNVYRLMLAATLTAVKYHDDGLLYNSDFAQLIGLSNQDVNALEIGFLGLLRFELFATDAEFAATGQRILEHSRRGLLLLQ